MRTSGFALEAEKPLDLEDLHPSIKHKSSTEQINSTQTSQITRPSIKPIHQASSETAARPPGSARSGLKSTCELLLWQLCVSVAATPNACVCLCVGVCVEFGQLSLGQKKGSAGAALDRKIEKLSWALRFFFSFVLCRSLLSLLRPDRARRAPCFCRGRKP